MRFAYALPYPPGTSMPSSGVMSRSAKPALNSARARSGAMQRRRRAGRFFMGGKGYGRTLRGGESWREANLLKRANVRSSRAEWRWQGGRNAVEGPGAIEAAPSLKAASVVTGNGSPAFASHRRFDGSGSLDYAPRRLRPPCRFARDDSY